MADIDDEDELDDIKEKASDVKDKVSETKDRAKQVTDQIKKISKNKSKAGAKTFANIGKVASKLGPALPWILLVIVILIVVIGILGFFMTMPGLMTGKLKQIAQGVGDWWQSLYLTGADAYTNKEDVIETANYIKSMGYDLIGYGFIPAKVLSAKSITGEDGVEIGEDGYLYKDGSRYEESCSYFDRYGIQYSTGGNEDGATGTFEVSGEVKEFADNVDTLLLRTYTLSDKRLYFIRNYEPGQKNIFKIIHDYFTEESSGAWSSGLISIYNAENGIASGQYKWYQQGYIEVNPENKTMKIKGGWGSNPIEYSMDGWSGRYGLSLEFLLSLHLATMSPELVTTMARSFDTEVQVYLDSISDATIHGYFRTDSGNYIEKEKIDEIAGGSIGNAEATKVMKDLGIKSRTSGDFKCENSLQSVMVGEDCAIYNILKYDAGKTKITDYSSWNDLQDGKDNGDVLQKSNMEDFFSKLNEKIEGLKSEFGITETETVTSLKSMTITDFASKIQNVLPFEEMKNLQSNNGNNTETKEYEIASWSIEVGTQKDGEAIKEAAQLKLFIEPEKQNFAYGNDIGFIIKVRRTYTESEKAGFENSESSVCSDHFGEEGFEVCDKCKDYVKTIRSALEDVKSKEGKFNAKVPYIARVVGSWFRDTYFVIPTEDDAAIEDRIKNNKDYAEGQLSGNNVEVINVDEEYLKDTEELWTDYEKNEDGSYKLFVLNEDGTIGVEWTKTEEEAEKEGITLTKKATTTEAKDLTGWSDSNGWSAYDYEAKPSTEKYVLEVDGETNEDVKKVTNYDSATGTFDENMYYSLEATQTVKQVRDGQRGVTNQKIKKMFKIRKYYIYDGTSERAEAIYNDWEEILENYKSYGNETITDENGFTTVVYNRKKCENEVQNAIDDLYYGTSTSTISITEDPRDPSLIGNITINKDTLSAFSILENTNTLDADYAYRDFKELIVELNYFDKEELSEKKDEVFEWIFPDLPSGNWPKRYFDKSEEMYGTLVHSEEMYDLLEDKEEALQGKNTVSDGEATSNEDDITVEKKEDEEEKQSVKTVDSEYLTNLKAKAEEIADYCTSKGYSYNTAVPSTSEPITALRDKSGVSCCAGALWVMAETSPELAELIEDARTKGYNFRSTGSMHDYFEKETNYEMTQVTSQGELQPGDLVFWLGHHTQLYLGDDVWFNSGGSNPVVKVSSWDAIKTFYSEWGVYPYAVHITGASYKPLAVANPFEGYNLGDAIVSPVTGEIVGVGTTEITNEAINGEEKTYEVDYIKIRALSNEDLDLLKEKLKENTHKYDSYETEQNNTDFDAYEDFYKDYEGVCEDYVITIKGLKNIELTESQIKTIAGDGKLDEAKTKVKIENAKVTKTEKVEEEVSVTIDTDTKEIEGTEKEFKINNYTKKETPNLLKDSDEDKFSALEDAKADAQCIVEVGGKTYIKAGTLIGYATDANIKILLRDDKNAVVENVEEYIELKNEMVTTGTPIQSDFPEEFIFWLGTQLEGACEGKYDLGDRYGFETLNDGAGHTTAFGLTKAVAGIAEKGGYEHFMLKEIYEQP
ncbi:MAG: hypothetical protein ACI4UE_05210, partial [Candidatus Scatovivens sp.]